MPDTTTQEISLPPTLKWYQGQALTTLNPDLKWDQQLIASALGLCGELAEVDPDTPSSFEIGDVFWYLAVLCDATGQQMTDILLALEWPGDKNGISDLKVLWRAMQAAGAIADIIKKITCHGHPYNASYFLEPKKTLLMYLLLFCERKGFCVECLLKSNIEKLQRRYAGGFSQEASINRSA